MRDNGRIEKRDAWLAGVDGCRAGWIAALVRPSGDEVLFRVVPRFSDLFATPENPAIIAVDIPIGLPERTGHGGRSAENAIRSLLALAPRTAQHSGRRSITARRPGDLVKAANRENVPSYAEADDDPCGHR